MFWKKQGESALARSSVTEDWYTPLSTEKNRIFDAVVREWEEAYAVFSVPLDDAMSLRAEGHLVRARQCVELAAAVVSCLTEPLSAACRILGKWGRHLHAPPSVEALNPSFYRSEVARQNAQWNQLMHHILFGSRSRFLHKLRVLEMSSSALGDEFHGVAEELASGMHLHPDASWPLLVDLHYDVNTCLREEIVVFKAFLRALSPGNLSIFHGELTAAASAAREAPRPIVSGVPR